MIRKILVIDDEAAIREMLRLALTRADFEVALAADATAARLAIADAHPDLILLDWMMPGVSGIEFARELRREITTHDIPLVMVSARGEEEDKVRGLVSGCDDYVTKPFSIPELVARIQAVLRRSLPGGDRERIEAGPLQVDVAGQRVVVRGVPVHLGPTEYRLLHFFISHPDRVYTREQLLDRVWGRNVYVEERTVDVHIRRLRRTLEPHGCDDMIHTVRGTGYRFSAEA